MRNNSNSRGGRRPPSAERKRTPFRRPGEGNLPRTRRVREDAPFSERAGLASPREAFGQMESEADGYRGFADRPIAPASSRRLPICRPKSFRRRSPMLGSDPAATWRL